jgi:LAGLIDADG DNA endonuclease family protein
MAAFVPEAQLFYYLNKTESLAIYWKNLIIMKIKFILSTSRVLIPLLIKIFIKSILFIKINDTLRDQMLEAINRYNKEILNNSLQNNDPNQIFGSYLAGLIEGDGTIYIPKDNKNNSTITIVFNSKDLPLALLIQSTLNFGTIHKVKGKNAYVFVIGDILGLIIMVMLLNGHMRTHKINKLYELID